MNQKFVGMRPLKSQTETSELELDQGIVDLYNECALLSTLYEEKSFSMNFIVVTEDSSLAKKTKIELRLLEAELVRMDIDNDLNDYTTLESIELLGDQGVLLNLRVNIADMSVELMCSSMIVEISVASQQDYEKALSRTKLS